MTGEMIEPGRRRFGFAIRRSFVAMVIGESAAGGEPATLERGAGDESRDDTEDVEPAVPVVSAEATAGIAEITAPMPRATASAPTRPTWMEGPIAISRCDVI